MAQCVCEKRPLPSLPAKQAETPPPVGGLRSVPERSGVVGRRGFDAEKIPVEVKKNSAVVASFVRACSERRVETFRRNLKSKGRRWKTSEECPGE